MPDTMEALAISRGMLRDIVACGDYHEVCRMLGLVPAGPDVDAVEHYKSHMRIEEVLKVGPEMFSHADIAADLLFRLVRLNRGDEEEDDGDEAERTMFAVISRTAVATVLGHLLENGALGVSR